MQITNDLNLAFPIRFVERPDPKDPKKSIEEPALWAYHTPISREVFEANYRVIAATKAELWGKGLPYMAGAPNIARLELIRQSKAIAAEDGSDELAPALLNEIARLTHILVPGENGFELMPVDIAIRAQKIDAEEWREAEGTLVFFTCAYAMARRANREGLCLFIARTQQGSITSLPPMEFAASLKISTPDATSALTETSSATT